MTIADIPSTVRAVPFEDSLGPLIDIKINDPFVFAIIYLALVENLPNVDRVCKQPAKGGLLERLAFAIETSLGGPGFICPSPFSHFRQRRCEGFVLQV